MLKQGTITFVFVSPILPGHPEAYRLDQHGDAVSDLAIAVEDVEFAYNEAIKRGAKSAREPTKVDDGENGVYEYASIKACEFFFCSARGEVSFLRPLADLDPLARHTDGDTTHTFINRSKYKGIFAPGFKALEANRYDPKNDRDVGLTLVDHAVANVELGKMNEWVKWYSAVLGFNQLMSFDDKDISTE